MALDSRSRPMRRPARRRLPLLTALVLLTMAAGFWAWLCAPAAPQAAVVSAPRLHTAAVQVDAATADEPTFAAGDAAAADTDAALQAPAVAGRPFVAGPAESAGPAGSLATAEALTGVPPAGAGPRAPPVAS